MVTRSQDILDQRSWENMFWHGSLNW